MSSLAAVQPLELLESLVTWFVVFVIPIQNMDDKDFEVRDPQAIIRAYSAPAIQTAAATSGQIR
jgi:hypothetical protein